MDLRTFQLFLKFYKAVQQGNENELIGRCTLLKHLIENGLEILIFLSKTELKSISSALSLPFTPDTSKDDMILNVSDVMLDVHGDKSNGVISVIKDEERNLDEVEIMRCQLIVVIHFSFSFVLQVPLHKIYFFYRINSLIG